MLTKNTPDIESESNDVLLRDLEEGGRGDEDCQNEIQEVTMDDFAEKEGGSSKDEENMVNKKRVGNVKSYQRQVSKGKTAAANKRTIKKRGGQICKTKPLDSKVWEDFWASNVSGRRMKKAKHANR